MLANLESIVDRSISPPASSVGLIGFVSRIAYKCPVKLHFGHKLAQREEAQSENGHRPSQDSYSSHLCVSEYSCFRPKS